MNQDQKSRFRSDAMILPRLAMVCPDENCFKAFFTVAMAVTTERKLRRTAVERNTGKMHPLFTRRLMS